MSQTRPWSDDPIPTLAAKYHTAIDLTKNMEQVVYSLIVLKDNLALIDMDSSDLPGIVIQNTKKAVEHLCVEMNPGSLLKADLAWFWAHCLSDDERKNNENLGIWFGSSNQPRRQEPQSTDLREKEWSKLAKCLARFRDELQRAYIQRKDPSQGDDGWFSTVPHGVQIYGILIPGRGLLMKLLLRFCTERETKEHTFESIATWHDTWKEQWGTAEGIDLERDIAKRLGELNRKLVKAFNCAAKSPKLIQKRKSLTDETLWKLNRDNMKTAALNLGQK